MCARGLFPKQVRKTAEEVMLTDVVRPGQARLQPIVFYDVLFNVNVFFNSHHENDNKQIVPDPFIC